MGLNLEKTPLQLFSKKISYIKYIQSIQDDLDKIEKTKMLERKKHYLNQTYIIHLVSFWQAFIEELVSYGDRKLLINSDYTICKKQIDKFNTPSAYGIDKIFKNVLRINKITNNFNWDKMTNSKSKRILNDIMNLRHRIAHTGFGEMELDIEKNYEYMKHLYNLAYILQYTIDKEIGIKLEKFEVPYYNNMV